MRKVLYGFAMTLDGYLARPNGAVDYLVMDKDAEKLMADFFAQVDTCVMGRKSADVTRQMMSEGTEPPAVTGVVTYVFSRTWPAGKRNGFEVVNDSPAEFIRRLREQPGKHIFLMGGGELGRSFLREDLVDELHVGIVPILLGEGIPAFPPSFPQRDFELAECKAYSKGSVALIYRRIRANGGT